jgi:hypothetical protein
MRTPESETIQTPRREPRIRTERRHKPGGREREARTWRHVLTKRLASRKNSHSQKNVTYSSSKCKYRDQMNLKF